MKRMMTTMMALRHQHDHTGQGIGYIRVCLCYDMLLVQISDVTKTLSTNQQSSLTTVYSMLMCTHTTQHTHTFYILFNFVSSVAGLA